MQQQTTTITSTNPLSARYRQFAATLEQKAADKHADRLANTPKRALQASQSRITGDLLKRASNVFTALADGLDAGTLPDALKRPFTKTIILNAMETRTEHPSYYVLRDTGEYRDQLPISLALRELLTPTRPEELKARKIREMEQDLRFSKIPGFFPTPPEVVQRMIEAAEIEPGMRILEPSAGKGDIAEAVKRLGAFVLCIERNVTLSEILEAKGLKVANSDFLHVVFTAPYDRVLMNPPFENRQDAEHVRHAFKFLAANGRLVAIVSNGTLTASEKKCVEFREWLEANNATIEKLPEGSFKTAFNPTGVSVSMIVIDRPEVAKEEPARGMLF